MYPKTLSVLAGRSDFCLTLEPMHEKTNNLGSRPGPTRTGLYSKIRIG